MLDYILYGIFIGSFYVVIATGFSLIYGVMNLIDLAFGEYLMLGGYALFFIYAVYHVSMAFAFPLALLTMFAFAIVVHKLVIRRTIGQPMIYSFILTFGMSFMLRDFARFAFTELIRGITFLPGVITFHGLTFGKSTIFTFVVSVISVIGLVIFLKKSIFGKAIRAVSQEPDVSQACGINVEMVQMVAFAIGVTMAATGGALVAINLALYPAIGFERFLTKCFAIVVVGGIGSIPGAFAAGLILGIAESLGTSYFTAQIAEIIAFASIIFVLGIRPRGISGEREE